MESDAHLQQYRYSEQCRLSLLSHSTAEDSRTAPALTVAKDIEH